MLAKRGSGGLGQSDHTGRLHIHQMAVHVSFVGLGGVRVDIVAADSRVSSLMGFNNALIRELRDVRLRDHLVMLRLGTFGEGSGRSARVWGQSIRIGTIGAGAGGREGIVWFGAAWREHST